MASGVLKTIYKAKIFTCCESSLIGFVIYGYFSAYYGLLGNNESTFLPTMCNINSVSDEGIRCTPKVKSVTTSNGKCDSPITTLSFIYCGDEDTRLVNKPSGSTLHTQNFQQLHWVCQVQLGQS